MAKLPRPDSTITWGVRVAKSKKERPATGRLFMFSGEIIVAAELRLGSTDETEEKTSTVRSVTDANRIFKGLDPLRLK